MAANIGFFKFLHNGKDETSDSVHFGLPPGCYFPETVSEAGEGKPQKTDTANTEAVSPKRRTSYLKVIAALCAKSKPIDVRDRSATNLISREIAHLGLELSDDTIRSILREVRNLEDDKKP